MTFLLLLRCCLSCACFLLLLLVWWLLAFSAAFLVLTVCVMFPVFLCFWFSCFLVSCFLALCLLLSGLLASSFWFLPLTFYFFLRVFRAQGSNNRLIVHTCWLVMSSLTRSPCLGWGWRIYSVYFVYSTVKVQSKCSKSTSRYKVPDVPWHYITVSCNKK